MNEAGFIPARILIVNPFGMGNLLFFTPLIRNLRSCYPHSKISVLVAERKTRVLENDPEVHDMITFNRADYNRLKYNEEEVHPSVVLGSVFDRLSKDIIHYSFRDIADELDRLNSKTTKEALKWASTGRRKMFFHTLWSSFERCFYRCLLREKPIKTDTGGCVCRVQRVLSDIDMALVS